MGELLTPTHLLIIAVAVIVLFGGKKLPELGRGFGEGLKGLRDGMRSITDEDVSHTREATRPPQ
jgi:sec-independent protein translocase protein TatA